MTPRHAHPIGTPGQPWGEAERSLWRSRQRRQRSYAGDVLEAVAHLHAHWDVQPYGELDYAPDFYPLVALHSADWSHDRPIALVTGGVHGYETSGVHGALRFAAEHGSAYEGRINVLVVPCVSPWGYEHVQRWNPAAVERVTHIAPADADGKMIGSPVVAHGVINYPVKSLGLCAGATDARYTTTTEVYPDSPQATPEQCNAAQVAAVRAAIDYALAHG